MNNIEITSDIDGNIRTMDIPSAGDVAQKTGTEFENEVKNFLHYMNIPVDEKKPSYIDYLGLRRRYLDIGMYMNGIRYIIECKRLNECQSHFQKLAYFYINLLNGCFDDTSSAVLVYSIGNAPDNYLSALSTYESLIRSAGGMVFEYNDFRRWICESKNEEDTSRDFYNSLHRFTD